MRFSSWRISKKYRYQSSVRHLHCLLSRHLEKKIPESDDSGIFLSFVLDFLRSALGNSACRACCCACSAFYAFIRIDFVMGISLRDSSYRTLACACSAAYTFIRNYICHDKFLLKIPEAVFLRFCSVRTRLRFINILSWTSIIHKNLKCKKNKSLHFSRL